MTIQFSLIINPFTIIAGALAITLIFIICYFFMEHKKAMRCLDGLIEIEVERMKYKRALLNKDRREN